MVTATVHLNSQQAGQNVLQHLLGYMQLPKETVRVDKKNQTGLNKVNILITCVENRRAYAGLLQFLRYSRNSNIISYD